MESHERQQRDAARFWAARCDPFLKGLLLLSVATGFLVQTLLVYTDSQDTVLISDEQLVGRRLWHQHNCQSCHQFHGFGGFLGPDLTNATARMERSQLDSLLTAGIGQMPSFNMEVDEINAMWSFLTAMNETGTGQARNPNIARLSALVTVDGAPPVVATSPGEAMLQVISESGDEVVAEGFELLQTRSCLTCHVLFARSSLGAPDLSRSGRMLSSEEMMTVLTSGRPPKMPKPVLSSSERVKVQALIIFMAAHRAEILARVVEEPSSFWTSLPWWEYP